jgi:hypothetical protein
MTEIDEDNLDRSETDTPEPSEPIADFPKPLGRPTTRSAASPEVVEQLSRIAAGALIPTSGPTGKVTGGRYPSIAEQLRAADILAKLSFVLPVKEEPPPEPEPEPPDYEVLLKAVLEHAGVQPPKAVADPTGGEVISISDPAEIAKHDAAVAAAPSTPKPRKDPNRIDLGEGFYALRDMDRATGRQRWACFNSANDFCAFKQTEQAWSRLV